MPESNEQQPEEIEDVLQTDADNGQTDEYSEESAEQTVKGFFAGLIEGEAKESDDEPQQTPEAPAKKDFVIDDELAKQYPAVNTLKGKPVSELAKAYAELQRHATKTSQELANMRKQASPQKPVEAKPEPITEEEFKDFIDMSPKEQKEFLEKRDKKIIEQFQKELAEIKNSLNPVNDVIQERQQKQLIAQIESVTPEGIEPMDLLNSWRDANKESLFNPDGTLTEMVEFYERHPGELVKQLAIHAKLLTLEGTLQQAKSRSKVDVYKQTKQVLNSSVKSTPKVPASVPRETDTPNDIDSALDTIYRRATSNDLN